jgi:hypothetical protein
LWKYNDQGHPKLSNGVLKLTPYCAIWDNDVSTSIEKERSINSGIPKYMEFWRLNIMNNDMYTRAMGYIEYWASI